MAVVGAMGFVVAIGFTIYLAVMLLITAGIFIYYGTMKWFPEVLPYVPFIVTALIVKVVTTLI